MRLVFTECILEITGIIWRARNNHEQRRVPRRDGDGSERMPGLLSISCMGGRGSEPSECSKGKNGVTQSLSHTNPAVQPSDEVREACPIEASSSTPVSQVPT